MDVAGALPPDAREESPQEGGELHQALLGDHRPADHPGHDAERRDQVDGAPALVGMLEVGRVPRPAGL